MLSVTQSAQQLGVSPARVRALIAAGLLPAAKNGREWVLREEDVMQRLADRPRPGRPRRADSCSPDADLIQHAASASAEARDIYDACKDLFRHMPTAEMMAQARSREEASFYMAVANFFLQQRQAELVAQGVF